MGSAHPTQMLDRIAKKVWIANAIGNSRYHWAWFLNTQLQASWDTDYVNTDVIERFLAVGNGEPLLELLPIDLREIIKERQLAIDLLPIYLCSVVPTQTVIWQKLPQVKHITLADIPLLNLYPTLGIDRALAALGACQHYGYPSLVIDGGTALTITGINRDRSLTGGAIMPGLKLQFRSLFVGTAALPEVILPAQLPPRWSADTTGAIASGVLHVISSGIRDFINDWQQLFPDSKVIFTGGDGEILAGYLQSILAGDLDANWVIDRQLIFHGFSAIVNQTQD